MASETSYSITVEYKPYDLLNFDLFRVRVKQLPAGETKEATGDELHLLLMGVAGWIAERETPRKIEPQVARKLTEVKKGQRKLG